MIGALSGLQRGVGIALIVALVIAVAWGGRVDHLRARYKGQLGAISVAIEQVTGRKIGAAQMPVMIEAIGIQRDRLRGERNEARGVVDRQSASIRALSAETARQTAIGVRNRKLAEATMRERDAWIERAAAAETRTVRASAEAEVAECERVLDGLYADGF